MIGSANPIDAFVLAKLREQRLAPAAPADRRTLIRRVTFDLIGLPPTPKEVDAFLADSSADAYERARRSPAGQPALRRALGPALDGRRPFRRDARPRPGPHPPERVAVSRLSDRARSTPTSPTPASSAEQIAGRRAVSRRRRARSPRSVFWPPARGMKVRCATSARTASTARPAITSTATTW